MNSVGLSESTVALSYMGSIYKRNSKMILFNTRDLIAINT